MKEETFVRINIKDYQNNYLISPSGLVKNVCELRYEIPQISSITGKWLYILKDNEGYDRVISVNMLLEATYGIK